MGGGNNNSSGMFQFLPWVYWVWKLTLLSRMPTHVWQGVVVSEYGHGCYKTSDIDSGECFFCDTGISISSRKDT